MVSDKQKASQLGPPLIVIGNGMVSWRLCRQLVDYGVNVQRPIVVFGEESLPAYDRVNLTKFFVSDKPEALLLSPAKWYADNGITLHVGRRIIKLDTSAASVVDDLGETYHYGDCVFATGSRAFVPPIDGVDSENVFVYRTVEDINAIKAAAQGARRGLVIGGGLLGIEAANVLRDASLETCIIQAANGLMSRQLDEDAASYLLREIAKLGMRVRLKTNTKSIRRTESGLEVGFNVGDSMEVDLVVVATGISPRGELAADAGISIGARGAILVNDKLQTSVPNVYAIGECASHRGETYGLVAPGYEMADTLANILSGKKKAAYKGSDHSCRLKLLGVEVGTFGDYLQEGSYHIYRGERSYRSLLFKGSKLTGATVVGDWAETAAIERAVKEKRSFGMKARKNFERTGDLIGDLSSSSVLLWPDMATVCNCTRTTCGDLKKAVGAGCLTVEALTDKTGAGSVCGSCQPQLAEFVGEDASKFVDTSTPKGGLLLWISALVALVTCLAFIFIPAFPAAESVQGAYYRFTRLWQDSLTKQITGYTIAGLSLLALLLSARKRFRWLSLGNYGFWRAMHSWLGVTTLVGILLHTGLNFGENLNLWLLICFLGLNLAGGLAAVAVAAEKRFSSSLGGRIRALATKAHVVFFMPYPVLLGFHIAKVYIY